MLKELFIDEFIENTRDSDKVLSKSVYDGLNVHIRNLMKLEGMAETWEDDLVSGDLPADEAIRTSAEIASLRNTITPLTIRYQLVSNLLLYLQIHTICFLIQIWGFCRSLLPRPHL